ncbi:MAG: sensor domain-containing diguanylate cyclase [Candidatus Competibacteraceae bacterium]|jgi:diguanylate cyclase (GGDEF)-like protein/PAS domain S-box-containing protein|nr:sensor domain-containing diguanylate cyclase [Candidatus Competibacteraceae bacterium]
MSYQVTSESGWTGLAAAVLETTNEAIVVMDRRYRILSVNPAFSRLTGYSNADVLNNRPGFLMASHPSWIFIRKVLTALLQTGRWQGEVLGRRNNGEPFVAWLSLAPIKDHAGSLTYYVGISHDITLRKEDEERLWRQANFDLLTGLPNRYLFMDRLSQAVARKRREHGFFSLLYLDLDGFKSVNDELGHAAGDALLQTLSRRMLRSLRASDTLARLGGDEFTVILLDQQTIDQAAHIATKLLRVLAMPAVLEQGTVRVHASIGIAVYPDHAQDAEALIQQADAAMYAAKQQGKNGYRIARFPELPRV